jgi:hypothetical protein
MVFGLPSEVLGILMRLGRVYRYGLTRKVALAAFEAFAVEALKTVDVSRTETKYGS